MTLAELRHLYPHGHLNIGGEEGGYFNYSISRTGGFGFEMRTVPEGCFSMLSVET